MTAALRHVAAATAFLTSAPLGRWVPVDARDVRRGSWAFPLVGGAVGGISGLVADVAADWLPSLVAGGLAVGIAAILTGGLHLDALADTADSFGAGSRERALEIMRDHATGAFGVVALTLVCLVDAAVLGTLAETDDAAVMGLAAAAAGRAAMLPVAYALPYARAGEGQGRLLADIGAASVAVGIGLALVLAVPAGADGFWAPVAAALAALAVGLVAWRRLGGMTGDVLGAAAKLAETAALVALVAALG